jgi:hypothetical protein
VGQVGAHTQVKPCPTMFSLHGSGENLRSTLPGFPESALSDFSGAQGYSRSLRVDTP